MKNFYKNKKILITGHTGFKGSWISYVLYLLGAEVTGIALEPITHPALFQILGLEKKIDSRIVDIRNLDEINKVFDEVQPEIVFHLAAQPLVIDSYDNPVYTYDVNVMGTVNICECIRHHTSVKSFINITTDKVYQNNEWCYGYRETDVLNGYDPYSNSKSCSELVTSSYKKSFFCNLNLAVSTCRAGNVIGGGDFSKNRIIPDCINYAINNEDIIVRNPNSIRPYQHVLEPIFFYLHLAMSQYKNLAIQDSYNIGPNEFDCIATGQVAEIFCGLWGDNIKWKSVNQSGPHEANFLKLDCSKAKEVLGWSPVWNIKKAIYKTIEWTKCFYSNGDIEEMTSNQISEFMKEFENLWKK